MKNTISVIVPVYNVASYLPKCIESILDQSYKKLEIILIDDGSTDESGKICDDYANRDTRIKVIHQKNGGAANAKNAGLRIAKGEYLSFVDSDDYLEPTAYELLHEKLENYHVDVVQGSFRNIYVDKVEDYKTIEKICEYSTVEYLERYTIDWTCGLLWDKLFRRNLFEGIRFEEGHKIDDEFFTYQGIMKAKKILHIPDIIYNYRKRLSSVMLQMESQQKILLDKLDYLQKRRKKVVACFPELKQVFEYHFLSMLVILSRDMASTETSVMKIKDILKTYMKEGKTCKIDLTLRVKLYRLQFESCKNLLKLKEKSVESKEMYRCFE